MKKRDSQKAIELLENKGLTFKQLQEMLEVRTTKNPTIIRGRRTKRFKLGVVSDTHLVDKGCALSELHRFYELCKKSGVRDVVHAGDMFTGLGSVYKGQINDLVCFGFDDHMKYVVENYPNVKGVHTYFIGGNHDEDYKKVAGIDIGRALADKRADLTYLGLYDATIVLNGVSIGLHHGDGGNAYAISYKLQKFIEKIGAGQKPQIYILGHYHGSFYMFYRNIHAFLPGCWQKPNDFSVRAGFPNMIGGYILDMDVADDERHSITEMRITYVPFYD